MRKQFSFRVFNSTGSDFTLEVWAAEGGNKELRTSEGKEVVRVAIGQYRIVETGEMLTARRLR